MSDSNPASLHSLRDKPFELLREMERRSRAAMTGSRLDGQDGDEWVGIGCQLANLHESCTKMLKNAFGGLSNFFR